MSRIIITGSDGTRPKLKYRCRCGRFMRAKFFPELEMGGMRSHHTCKKCNMGMSIDYVTYN